MHPNADLLTPTEAAVVANVSVRDIHRVIDEHIVPSELVVLKGMKGGRRLTSDACTFAMFYYHSAAALTSHERSRVIRHIHDGKAQNWVFRHDFLTVDLHHFHDQTRTRRATLMRAREMVIEDPEILGGVPVIRGTRVPVYDIAASLASGASKERLLAAYPSLKAEQLDLAALYAQANPVRGRPRRRVNEVAPSVQHKVTRRPRP